MICTIFDKQIQNPTAVIIHKIQIIYPFFYYVTNKKNHSCWSYNLRIFIHIDDEKNTPTIMIVLVRYYDKNKQVINLKDN